ncbi:hypothetical protein APS56_07515 [Pseudalgibacter alginicilyticus]|uniref:3-keto-alpha-glucoside-1,2-lyase/3-keto-2-hydroxy-glucal hydratase domain-containing protein n=1 Tax=Pseudalgibacter alginicilyticus TaxID=1736674 RepID=A0A0P0CQ17_9FLAO|nr:DUF1080 domain-containing protein [Pseudalgibacter alginicilyticus]ALJ04980.1 hypothetical protein APS56_07515 [Pseudalgibacter alginicilyticus]
MKKIGVLVLAFWSFLCFAQEKEQKMKPQETEVWEPKVPVVTPGINNLPPSDAIVLFNGSDLKQWVNAKDGKEADWIINNDGSMTVKNKSGNIKTKQNFGSIQLHIEWKSPKRLEGSGQHRANSGVFLQGLYEIQVLDNNGNNTYVNGQAGSVYKQSVPLVHAAVETGEWNTYDIIYHQPEFDLGGNVTQQATVTVLFNGILVQDHFKIIGPTKFIGYPKYEKHGKGPLILQDHQDNSRVSYRNIWLREL